MGVFVSTVFFNTVIDPTLYIDRVIIMSTFLSILGQLGDLVFSAIKRYFGCKDFSNIMPGHGGVLDRLDSIIFVMLGYMFLCQLYRKVIVDDIYIFYSSIRSNHFYS